MLPFYDRTESRYPIVDNIAEEGVGAKFVAAASGVDQPDAAAPLLRLLLTKTTWQQFRMDLDDGDVQAPAWDLARIRGDLASFVSRLVAGGRSVGAACKQDIARDRGRRWRDVERSADRRGVRLSRGRFDGRGGAWSVC